MSAHQSTHNQPTAAKLNKAALPHTPTVDKDGNPTTCFVCARHAMSIGIGNIGRGEDPKYLCSECLLIVENVRAARRMDAYELQALDAGIEAVGDFINDIGGKTELADFDELEQRMLVKAAWEGCARGVRKAIAEGVPF
jgi:hypothetical protein